MLIISNLSIHFANRYLFDGINFSVSPGSRIGLIGRNGTGKSTLLKIITGDEQPEEGCVSMPNDYAIGYLPQDGISTSTTTVYNETSNSLIELKTLESRIKKVEEELSSRTDYESRDYMKLVEELSTANEHFRLLGGHSIDANIEQILLGLGFSRTDFHRKVQELSGGWQMRVELAKILLRRPDIILLDEPTNHLDIESIQWLEGFLKNYEGAVFIVSHDRAFLDAVTNRTIEIMNGKIYDYNLNYSNFILQRQEIRRQIEAQYKAQQKEIAETEKYIERFRYKSTLASRVQSRIKQLDKIERIEIEDEDVSSIRFKFPIGINSGRLVVETRALSKSYGEKLILSNIDFAIEKGERLAFVGKNGEGKTTFSKILAGVETYDGFLNNGYNVQIGYYAQHQAEMLDGNSNVFEVIDNVATGEMRSRVRSLLGAFLFSGEAIYKKVKVLSGGEKSRLALAKLLLQPSNFLILDEPTNHLDMLSKDVLKKALMDYAGTLVIVSHDREFLHELTNRTIHFINKGVNEYSGDIYDFIASQKIESLSELGNNKSKEQITQKNIKNKVDRESQKIRQREENRIKKQIKMIEEDIAALEEKIKSIELEFSDPNFFNNIEMAKVKQNEYDACRANLENKMESWAEKHEEFEKMSTQSSYNG